MGLNYISKTCKNLNAIKIKGQKVFRLIHQISIFLGKEINQILLLLTYHTPMVKISICLFTDTE